MTLIIGLLIFLVGLAMAGGGIWLAALGGSWYYAIAGIVMMLSGVLLVARHRAGAWLYWLVLAGTAAWTAWESGFDYKSEEHTSELQSLMRIAYAGLWLQKTT